MSRSAGRLHACIVSVIEGTRRTVAISDHRWRFVRCRHTLFSRPQRLTMISTCLNNPVDMMTTTLISSRSRCRVSSKLAYKTPNEQRCCVYLHNSTMVVDYSGLQSSLHVIIYRHPAVSGLGPSSIVTNPYWTQIPEALTCLGLLCLQSWTSDGIVRSM